MGTVYRVKDWEQRFENDRSRCRDRCGFVAMPNKNGKGKQLILREPDGAMIFGWFALVCEELSKQKKPRHGWLTDSGLPSDSPWTPAELTVITGCTAEQTSRAISVLIRPDIKWLVAAPLALPPDSLPTPARTVTEQSRAEQTREEQSREEQSRAEQRQAPVAAVSDPPTRTGAANNNGRHAPCFLALAMPYFGCQSLAVAEAYVNEAVGKIGEELAYAWLLSASADKEAGSIKTNPLQYYRGLCKKGEPDDKWLQKAKESLRPRELPQKDRGSVLVGDVVATGKETQGAPHV